MIRWLLFATMIWNGEKVSYPDSQWRELLGRERYNVMRRKATEGPFLGQYVATQTPGVYHCAACGLSLFDSKNKYYSGSGWPSFTAPVSPKNLYFLEDWSMGFKRYEVLCRQCDSHLGHIFNDGPVVIVEGKEQKMFRYCINSISLKLK